MVEKNPQYAVLGSPIAHSLSPLLYRSAAEARGLDYTFTAIDVDVTHFEEFMNGRDTSWKGFSVTMPNKLAALAYADNRSGAAQLIGAANTLWLNDQGKWHAENTDVDGIIGAFHFVHLSPHDTQQKLLILGAGGTARAVVYAAHDYADEIILAVRNISKAEDLAYLAAQLEMKLTIIELNSESLRQWCPQVAMVISTLPQGVVDAFTAEISLAPRLFDVLYHPWPTPVMRYCREHTEMRLVSGITMLLYQALSQFKFMIGEEPPQEAMADALAQYIRIPRHEFCSID